MNEPGYRAGPAQPLAQVAGLPACFVVIKAIEYREKISAAITPSTNDFYMYHFVLTGLHLGHVIIGSSRPRLCGSVANTNHSEYRILMCAVD